MKVDPKVLSGTLLESLEGMPRQTVLSELSVAKLIAEDRWCVKHH